MSAFERGCARSARRLYALGRCRPAGVMFAVFALSDSRLRGATATITVAAHDYDYERRADGVQVPRQRGQRARPADPDPPTAAEHRPNREQQPRGRRRGRGSRRRPGGREVPGLDRSAGHKMWGKHIQLPQDAGEVRIGMRATPDAARQDQGLRLRRHQLDQQRAGREETGLGGFHVTIEDQTVTRSRSTTSTIRSAGAIASPSPTASSRSTTWPQAPTTSGSPHPTATHRTTIQTSTFEGGFGPRRRRGGKRRLRRPRGGLWEPLDRRTGFWFGFAEGEGVRRAPAPARSAAPPATGSPGRRSTTSPDLAEPVAEPYVALSDTAQRPQVYTGRGNPDGNFTIQNVPAGTYTLAIWDDQLDWIIRFMTVNVGPGESTSTSATSACRAGSAGSPAPSTPTTERQRRPRRAASRGSRNIDVDKRWRDGSIKQATFTDNVGNYEFPSRGRPDRQVRHRRGRLRALRRTGASLHDEYDPRRSTPVPEELGGGLLTTSSLTRGTAPRWTAARGHYADDEPGQIAGIVYYATTRNEIDARLRRRGLRAGDPGRHSAARASAPTASRTPPTTPAQRVRHRPLASARPSAPTATATSAITAPLHRRAQAVRRPELPRGADHRPTRPRTARSTAATRSPTMWPAVDPTRSSDTFPCDEGEERCRSTPATTSPTS